MKGLFVAIMLAAWVSAANPNDPGQGRATLEPVHAAEVRPPSGNADFIKGRFQKRYPNSAFIEAELEKHGIVHLHDDEKKFPRVEDYAGMDLSFENISEAPALPGCFSQGESWDEAVENIREAIEGWLLSAAEMTSTAPAGKIIELNL